MPPRRTVASAIRASAYCPDAAVRHPGFACVQSSLVGTATPDLVYARSSLEAKERKRLGGHHRCIASTDRHRHGGGKSLVASAVPAESSSSVRRPPSLVKRCGDGSRERYFWTGEAFDAASMCMPVHPLPPRYPCNPPCTLLDVPPSRLPARKSPCREARSASFDVARSR